MATRAEVELAAGEGRMAAQFIVIARQAEKKEGKKSGKARDKERRSASPSGEAGSGPDTGSDPYGPFRPIPIGVLKVYGQKPIDLGHFDSVMKLLDRVQSEKELPGGSNTLFASVENLEEVHSLDQARVLQSRLDALPGELTIIVREGE